MLLGARQFFERRGAPTPLPYDAEVEYLESTGAQYIIVVHTVFVASSYYFLFDVQFNLRPSSGYFGIGFTSTVQQAFLAYNSSAATQIYMSFANNTDGTIASNLANDTNRHVAEAICENGNLKYTFDGVEVLSKSGVTNYSLGPFSLFSLSIPGNSNINKMYGRIYRAKFINDNVDFFDFIPVRFTNEQGVSEGAMYDRVSRKLFRNAGTGAFVIGPDK